MMFTSPSIHVSPRRVSGQNLSSWGGLVLHQVVQKPLAPPAGPQSAPGSPEQQGSPVATGPAGC